MKYKVNKRYRDSELNRVVKIGEEIELHDLQRAEQLIGAGLVEAINVPKKRGRKPKK